MMLDFCQRMPAVRCTLAISCLILGACSREAPSEAAGEPPGVQAVQRKTALVDGARIRDADSEPGNWLSNGRTYSEQRYSPLDQVTEANVADLGLAWYLDLDTNRGQQASPLVVDGVMYSTSAWSKVQAIDAATGELLWQYDPQVPKEWDSKSCCGVQNRGAAVWKGRVYAGTLDGRLIAIDAASGELAWETQTTDRSFRYSITGAPRIVKDKVIIGNGGAEYGVRGYVTAYDTETGEQVWRFYTVPGDPSKGFENDTMKMAAETWTGTWWSQGGGGTAWDSFAYDPQLELLYIGVGNGSPWPRALRSPGGGDNLFLCSIVAVRPDTGEYVWHYQTVPGDTWDYTAVQHMILADIEIDRRLRKVIMQAPKNGFFYVLDRETGEFISAENIMPVNWATHIDPHTGRPVETEFARYDETGKAVKIVPGPGGAHNWQPMSYSPDTGLVYIPAKQQPYVYFLDEGFKFRATGVNLGVNNWDINPADFPLNVDFLPEDQGRLLAWNPVTQREVWRAPNPGSHNGGVLSTAGNLVFQGNADAEFVAYRATDGERLWTFDVQSGITAPPVTYAVDNEQYVAVLAGWGSIYGMLLGEVLNPDGDKRNISRVLSFKLGGRAELPPPPPMRARSEPPPAFGDEVMVEEGRVHYARNCAACHGINAVSGGTLPDLRYTPMLATEDAWRSVVIDGALADRGMISFADNLTAPEAEALRAYVVNRAHEAKSAN
ncbi:MAG: PQQ-dependent dehydrogenase, methanol/ethanol family [Woeseiaceae bacterium]|nr:PQQ-dependent dehydrogenase, methanol/ethanol family [Woeseiaceae bacterium]